MRMGSPFLLPRNGARVDGLWLQEGKAVPQHGYSPWSSKPRCETRTQPAPILPLSGTCSVPRPPELGVCAHPLLQTHSRRHRSLRERSRAASSAAHSCEQMPPVGAEASQSSPECSFKDISAAQLSFHLCVFFCQPPSLLSTPISLLLHPRHFSPDILMQPHNPEGRYPPHISELLVSSCPFHWPKLSGIPCAASTVSPASAHPSARIPAPPELGLVSLAQPKPCL